MDAKQGNNVFLKVSGAASRDIHLMENNFHDAKFPYQTDSDVNADAVTALDNFPAAR